nr:retrotransposon protein, putative, Ty1-copia subclass [Tanacetum cinerariifolium]
PFEKQKLTGPNFIDCYRKLRLVLSIEDKKNYLEHLIPVAPVAPPRQQVPPAALTAHAAWVKRQKEELKAMYSKQAEQELLQTVREFYTSKQEEVSLNKDFDSFVQNYNMHGMRKTVNELHAMLKLHEEMLPKKDDNPGLRGSKKMKLGVLSLYVGDGHRAAVEAIRTYHLVLPSRLVIVLINCHYAPSITRGVIPVSRLFNNGFVNRFDDNKVFQKEVENQLRKTIKSLRFDRGGVYMSQEFLDHLKEHGIIAHRTPPYTPQHNGVSKRRNRTLLDMVRSMMSQTTLPKSFWDYALETVARILNMVPTKKVNKTPYEIWHGQAPKLSYLKVWGCKAFVKRYTLTKPDKLDPRSFKCIFVGYPKETMGYSFYSPSENKVFVAQNAEFFEYKLLDLKASGSVKDLELYQEEDTNPSVDTSLNHEKDDQEIDEPQSDINPIRKSFRTSRVPDRMCLYIDAEKHELGDLGEPANYKAALLDPESKKWLDAMNEEMQSMKDNDVWVLVELPPNARTIGSKWIFKKKTDMDGAVYIFKAHLVAKGFTQTYGVDYEETFSPVADIRAIRILIDIAA